MQELPRLAFNYSSETIVEMLSASLDELKTCFDGITMAQVVLSMKNVELDTVLHELVEEYPEKIAYFEKKVSSMTTQSIETFIFPDASMIVFKNFKFYPFQI